MPERLTPKPEEICPGWARFEYDPEKDIIVALCTGSFEPGDFDQNRECPYGIKEGTSPAIVTVSRCETRKLNNKRFETIQFGSKKILEGHFEPLSKELFGGKS